MRRLKVSFAGRIGKGFKGWLGLGVGFWVGLKERKGINHCWWTFARSNCKLSFSGLGIWWGSGLGLGFGDGVGV